MSEKENSEILNEKVLLAVSHGIILLDPSQKILLWNDWIFRHSNISAHNAVGKYICDIFPEINQNIRLKNGIKWCLDSGKYTLISERYGSSPLLLHSESRFIINPRIILGPVKFNNEFYCCFEIYDSSSYLAKERFARGQTRKLKETQVSLIETSRLAALGAIVLRANQIKRILEKNPTSVEKVVEFSELIVSICHRIESIIKGLRHFARSGENDPFSKSKVSEIIRDTILLCASRMENHNIQILIEDKTENVEIECRPAQISQVILNILSNAQHAISQLPDEKWIKISTVDGDKFVEIRITDNGPGIAESIVSKIFLPFFTTKDLGVGTGLGLSISSGIVKDHGGSLSLDKNEKNTTFVIQLLKIQNEKEKK